MSKHSEKTMLIQTTKKSLACKPLMIVGFAASLLLGGQALADSFSPSGADISPASGAVTQNFPGLQAQTYQTIQQQFQQAQMSYLNANTLSSVNYDLPQPLTPPPEPSPNTSGITPISSN
ncbi:MAG: hypothetical protein K0Q57_19 [Gammaproteobacteria bacterium]|jgi:hypothetical protein|nr:hypothetical protein [Gammaproteobacteria bacterium]